MFLLLGLTACSDQTPNQSQQDEQVVAQVPDLEPLEPPPLLTLNELLNADDVKQGLASAAKDNDIEALKMWQERLLSAGEEVSLRRAEMTALSGDQGIALLKFQGMKTNYQNDFESVFFEFGDVDAVFARYPAFETLQAQSKVLVDKRDELINKAAEALEEEGLSEQEALQEARSQWQSLMQSQRTQE